MSITGQDQLLASLGVDHSTKRTVPLDEKWISYSLNHDRPTKEIPIIMITQGPKNIKEVKKAVRGIDTCIIIFVPRNTLLLKAPNVSNTTVMESESEYERISNILDSCDITRASSETDMQISIMEAIDKIPNSTGYFDNRGIFSTHYLKSRLFDELKRNIEDDVEKVRQVIGKPPDKILETLGWKTDCDNKTISIIVTKQEDFSIKSKNSDVAPSYTAISKLQKSRWVILTNGRKWRLYTNRISASSTNYFEITLGSHDSGIRYLVAIFGADSYKEEDGQTVVDSVFDEGKNYATSLEEDLSSKIMSPRGLFLDIVKGVLDHDMRKTFTLEELDEAKKTSLEIMYRVWFIAYAESRSLLPVRDEKYRPISLQSIRSRLDSYENDSENTTCWSDLLKLFEGIRNGNVSRNLPQYNGVLFSVNPDIDGILVKNRFIAPALSGLLEKDGESMDYASLGVRHLGSIFESLMEFVVRQAEKDLMLLEDSNGIREVKTEQESTYSYKKNDLYLVSRGGIALRKMTASYYTPNYVVEFLVRRGLEPIFAERKELVEKDLQMYKDDKTEGNLQTCMDRLLDIQILDPAMGSGHFLVEALNQITAWATGLLDRHPDHPLLDEIERERNMILSEQKKKGITIDESLLTYDVLLKRKIMKRCIFGVDLNPMAVELAKLSLWLDSFAIGVPLTFMDHHIKLGDSTIGMFMSDLEDRGSRTLDDFMPDAKSNEMICDVISNSDITVQQVRDSEDMYAEHRKSLEPTRRILDALTASKIEPNILPKKGKEEFIRRFGTYSKNESADFVKIRKRVNELAKRHRFFHWELEMMDAFTDKRKGFDLITGNPPWEKVKLYDDEFFTPHYPAFRSLATKTEKDAKKDKLLKNLELKKEYEKYKRQFKEKSAFYRTYEIQGVGDKDLWQLVLERSLNLFSENGMTSMIIPSQILSNVGAVKMREIILEKDILSLYVFENKNKIFPIHSSYRFALLSFRNSLGKNEFPAGFYLHNLDSLVDQTKEREKFSQMSKRTIYAISPKEFQIPESGGKELEIIEKIYQNDILESGIGDGWNLGLSLGFSKTDDADLLSDDSKGWLVFEGKNMHQFTHCWKKPEFTTCKRDGLERESRKRIYAGMHKEIYNSFRLVFRDIARSTDTRTTIASIIPPHTFHTCSLRSVVLTYNDKIILNADHNKKSSYLCGIFNSLTFDFVTRAKIQVHLPQIVMQLPIPKPIHENKITKLAGMLMVGSKEFESFADSLRISNVKLTPAQRIETAAELDALVAHSYGLTKEEYERIISTFKLFKRNPSLYEADSITWGNANLKEFYGEMASLALEYFTEITKDEQVSEKKP